MDSRIFLCVRDLAVISVCFLSVAAPALTRFEQKQCRSRICIAAYSCIPLRTRPRSSSCLSSIGRGKRVDIARCNLSMCHHSHSRGDSSSRSSSIRIWVPVHIFVFISVVSWVIALAVPTCVCCVVLDAAGLHTIPKRMVWYSYCIAAYSCIPLRTRLWCHRSYCLSVNPAVHAFDTFF